MVNQGMDLGVFAPSLPEVKGDAVTLEYVNKAWHESIDKAKYSQGKVAY